MLRALSLVLVAVFALEARADYLSRPFADDTMYFLVLDRFAKHEGDGKGLPGYDPANPRWFHGGNLKAAAEKLDYIKSLGATAVWMTPIFVNQTFAADGKSTGYHGYWILNFLGIDPHFGTEEDLKMFVAEAHKRDIKVFLDIVVNHTGDVIRYKECERCPYRDRANFPYSRRAADGKPINDGFTGDNFEKLTDFTSAYTPYIPDGQEHAKNPAWLNEIRYYHNRGYTDFKGESAIDGDFGGLDDVFTENPAVVAGFIDIYKYWIEKFHIDGYRIDTAKHVNIEFWQRFLPEIREFARGIGIPNFFMFGEVADFSDDSVQLARFTREGKFQGVLDFAFTDEVSRIVSGKGDATNFAHIFQADSLFTSAADLPIFVSNHDQGRLSFLIRRINPAVPEGELMARVKLGHALMMFSRGVPILYYGDEQGFVAAGHDALSREDMFGHFDPNHPMFRAIAEMTALRSANPVLRHGEFKLREQRGAPELIAFSRYDADEEFLVVANSGTAPREAAFEVRANDKPWQSVRGACPQSGVPGSYKVNVPALDYVICKH
jgi:glycosidase